MSYQFKVGDMVRVVRKTESHTPTWRNGWTTDMIDYIGSNHIFIISSIGKSGVRFKESGYGWDPASLELVEEAPKDHQGVICRKIKEMYKRREAAGYRF